MFFCWLFFSSYLARFFCYFFLMVFNVFLVLRMPFTCTYCCLKRSTLENELAELKVAIIRFLLHGNFFFFFSFRSLDMRGKKEIDAVGVLWAIVVAKWLIVHLGK